MKVAVILRGQPRCTEVGAKIFNASKFIKQNDVKVFGHFFNRDDYTLDQNSSPTELTNTEIKQRIISWNLTDYEVTDYAEVVDFINNVDLYNVKNLKNKPIWYELVAEIAKEQNIKFEHLAMSMEIILPFIRAYDPESKRFTSDAKIIEHLTVRRQLNLAINTFQILSAAKSYAILKKHIQKTSWQPDIIILSRTDNALIDLSSINVDSMLDSKVYSNINLSFRQSEGYIINDLNFVFTAKSAHAFFETLMANLYNSFTKSRIDNFNLFNYIKRGEAVWMDLIIRSHLTYGYLNFDTKLIRPNICVDDFKLSTNDYEIKKDQYQLNLDFEKRYQWLIDQIKHKI